MKNTAEVKINLGDVIDLINVKDLPVIKVETFNGEREYRAVIYKTAQGKSKAVVPFPDEFIVYNESEFEIVKEK